MIHNYRPLILRHKDRRRRTAIVFSIRLFLNVNYFINILIMTSAPGELRRTEVQLMINRLKRRREYAIILPALLYVGEAYLKPQRTEARRKVVT